MTNEACKRCGDTTIHGVCANCTAGGAASRRKDRDIIRELRVALEEAAEALEQASRSELSTFSAKFQADMARIALKLWGRP